MELLLVKERGRDEMRQIINESEFSVSWMKKYKREGHQREENEKYERSGCGRGGARVCRGGGKSTLTGAFKGMQPIGRRGIEIRVSARKK